MSEDCCGKEVSVITDARKRVTLIRRAFRLEWLTIIWMMVETAVAISAGVVAHSLLLFAFGIDSVIEIVSACVLIWRLSVELRRGRAFSEAAERRASRIACASFSRSPSTSSQVPHGPLAASGSRILHAWPHPDCRRHPDHVLPVATKVGGGRTARKPGTPCRRRVRMTTRGSRGRAAITHYEVRERIASPFGKFALVDVRIETGRTHQIRVHMSSIGHPVVGDSLYRAKELRRPTAPPTASPRRSRGASRSEATQPPSVLALDRNFLHAAAVEFTHPAKRGAALFQCPVASGIDAFSGADSTVTSRVMRIPADLISRNAREKSVRIDAWVERHRVARRRLARPSASSRRTMRCRSVINDVQQPLRPEECDRVCATARAAFHACRRAVRPRSVLRFRAQLRRLL